MAKQKPKKKKKVTTKKDVPAYWRISEWDTYFAVLADAASRKSKDPTMVGSVIVSPDKDIVSTGFNGLPRNVWDLEHIYLDDKEKLPWMCHAEMNAIINAARNGTAVKDCTIYTSKFPCIHCTKAIVQAGIVRLVTPDDWYWSNDPDDGADEDDPHERTKAILSQAKIKVYAPYHPDFRSNKDSWNSFRNASRKP